MNRAERDAYKPICNRCGQPITDIYWCDASTPIEQDLVVPGEMYCSTDGCFDARGSRLASPLVEGGLTLEDHAWLRAMRYPERIDWSALAPVTVDMIGRGEFTVRNSASRYWPDDDGR